MPVSVKSVGKALAVLNTLDVEVAFENVGKHAD